MQVSGSRRLLNLMFGWLEPYICTIYDRMFGAVPTSVYLVISIFRIPIHRTVYMVLATLISCHKAAVHNRSHSDCCLDSGTVSLRLLPGIRHRLDSGT
jgi:hypothetical protein